MTIYTTHLLRHLRATIGRNIHSARASRKITLKKMSKRTGIPEHSLDHYELGKGEIPLDQLIKIACVLDLKAWDLMV